VGTDIAYEEVKRLVPVGVDGETSLDVIYDAMRSQAVDVQAVRVDCDSGELKKYLPGIILVSGKIAHYSMEHVVYAEYDERSDFYRVYDPQVSGQVIDVAPSIMKYRCKGVVISMVR
jgi:hypothetical protein